MQRQSTAVRTIPRLAALMLTVVALTQAAWAGDIHGDVDRAIRSSRIGDAKVAVSIRDADTGAELVSHHGTELMIPASNMKLLTTGAALHVLGPGFRFETRIVLDGDRLIVIGDGDPAFGDPELLELMRTDDGVAYDVESFLNLWIEPVVQSGVQRLSEVLVDDRIFDRAFIHDSWPADQLNRHYCAEVAGLNFHLNALYFYPRPRPGQTPMIDDFTPHARWLAPGNRATSRTGRHDKSTVWIARKPGSNDLTFYGNVKFPMTAPVRVTVHDMPEFFAHLLAERLEEAGVQVDEYGVVESSAPSSEGEIVGPIIATPLSTAVTRCNQDSQNLYAEALLRRTAHAATRQPGTWINGSAVLKQVVHERLDDPGLSAFCIVADGSGLSRENRVAVSTMTAWLNTFHHDPDAGAVFIRSLARAGEDGTLAKRFGDVDLTGVEVRAKTGYINHVSCLSGYVTASDGRRRSFSIFVNDLASSAQVREAKRMQELIVAAIAEDLAAAHAVLGGD